MEKRAYRNTHDKVIAGVCTGLGEYFSPLHNAGWGEVMQFKASNVMKGDRPVVELHYFRISPYVVNNNGVYWNTSVREYTVNDLPAGSVGS